MTQDISSSGKPIAIIQTESRYSPPLVTLLATTAIALLLEKAIGFGIEELISRIKHRARVGKELRRFHEDLFGFLTSSQFVLGERFPTKEAPDEKLSLIDARLIAHIAQTLPFDLKDEPDVKEVGKIELNYETNICSVGHALTSDFSGFVLGEFSDIRVPHLLKEYQPELRWRFNYDRDPRARGKTFDQKRKLVEEKPPLNWVIEDTETRTEFIPYYDTRTDCYKIDYVSVVKAKSPHESGRYAFGSKVFIIAGCHELGTDGFRLVLDDETVLRKIHEEVGTNEFQAFFEVRGEKNEAQSVTLIGVKHLS